MQDYICTIVCYNIPIADAMFNREGYSFGECKSFVNLFVSTCLNCFICENTRLIEECPGEGCKEDPMNIAVQSLFPVSFLLFICISI